MNNKGADQTARMRRLVCAFVVRKPPKTGFLASRPILVEIKQTGNITFSIQIYSQILEDIHVRGMSYGAHTGCQSFSVYMLNSLGPNIQN